MAVDVGQLAPDFTLNAHEGGQVTLSQYRGNKSVVLAFFPGAFTGTCTSEMCALRDRADKLSSLNAQVLGISVDPPFSQKAWAQQHNLSFPILSDYSRQVVNQYDVAFQNLAGLEDYVSANRAVFVVDMDGVVRYRWVAPNPGVEPDYDKIGRALGELA